MAEEAAPAQPVRLSTMAVTSLSLAAGAVLFGFIGLASESGVLFTMVFLLFLGAIVTGVVALAQRRPNATPQERSSDHMVAAAGITIGTVGIVVAIVVVVLIILAAILFLMMMVAMMGAFASWW